MDFINFETYPLSHPQKRIWSIEEVYTNTPINNIGGIIKIKGTVDLKILEQAIQIFIEQNDGIRLQFLDNGMEAQQYIQNYTQKDIDFIDFSLAATPAEGAFECLQKEFEKPFLLINSPLYQFKMLKITNNEYGLFIKLHHLISDGWSIQLFVKQLNDNYGNLLNGFLENDKAPFTYVNFINSEREYLSSNRFLKDKAFWREKFEVLPEVNLIKSTNDIRGKRKTFNIDILQTNMIKEFVSKHNITINSLFVTVILVYLNKIYHQDDIIIGNPVNNRTDRYQRNTIGMFTSTMPIRKKINESMNFQSLTKEINSELRRYFIHQKYPFDININEIDWTNKKDRDLFQIVFNNYNTKLNNQLNGMDVENIELYSGYQLYPLQIVLKEWSDLGEFNIQFDYKVSNYNDSEVEQIFRNISTLINNLINDDKSELKTIHINDKRELNKLIYELNDTTIDYPRDELITELFERQANETPDNIAITFLESKITYKELNEKANQLARRLKSEGLIEKEIVGIIAEHSIEMVIAIFAILKAGAVYVPIDSNYPLERLNYIIKDSNPKIIINNTDLNEGILFKGKVINLLSEEEIFTGDCTNIPISVLPEDAVYIIYTSGSTGKPKGSVILHRGLVNYIWWAKQNYIKDNDDTFALYSSISFDLTVTSIFTPLISGNKIIIYKEIEQEFTINRILSDNQVTVIKMTPAHLSMIRKNNHISSSIQRIIVGGEDLKYTLARDIYNSFNGKVEIINEYGPTETVVGCLTHIFDPEIQNQSSVPIGKPISNVKIYLLDQNLQPVPVGVIGELYISGDGVSAGYLNRSELTDLAFIDSPFIDNFKMYKTGDLAVLNKEENYEYIGRLDNQIKINGYRIELGEIENNLLAHDEILEAIVIDKILNNGTKVLLAYIVLKSDDVQLLDIKKWLSERVSHYMMPAHFIVIDSIPLTINGKINRAELPEPNKRVFHESDISKTHIESILTKVIGDVLKVKKVSPLDNFFYLGGDSIKAIQVVAKLNEYGLKLKIKDILNFPTITELSYLVGSDTKKIALQNHSTGTIKPTPIIEWFFMKKLSNMNHWNQSVLIDLDLDIKIEDLNKALYKIIEHHDTLRLRCSLSNTLYYNNQVLDKGYETEVYDLSKFSYTIQLEKLEELGEGLKSSFNIYNSLLFKASLFDLGVNGRKLLLTAHHLVIDAVSWRIILEDLKNLLTQENNKPHNLPLKTDSFQSWSDTLYSIAQSTSIINEIDYWCELAPVNLEKYFINDLYKKNQYLVQNVELMLSVEETKILQGKANHPYKTQTKDLLLISLGLALNEFTKEQNITIEVEGHGREDISDSIDVSRTVGWFTTIYPFQLVIDNKESITTNIKLIKEQIKKVPNNGIGYGILRYLTNKLISNEENFIRFNFIGEIEHNSYSSIFSISNDNSGIECSINNKPTSLFDVIPYIVNEQLKVIISFTPATVQEDKIKSFINIYMSWIKKVLNHCINKENIEITPSDFDTITISQNELDGLFK